jgi:hypothetical protein
MKSLVKNQINCFKKEFLIGLLLFNIASFVQAQSIIEIKLKCEVDLRSTSSTGTVERETKMILIEITQTKESLSMIPVDTLASVSTYIKEKKLIDNFSNENKWHLENTYEVNEGVYITSMRIDRNTGMLSYNRNFLGKLVIEGSGNCEKIDKNKRKF